MFYDILHMYRVYYINGWKYKVQYDMTAANEFTITKYVFMPYCCHHDNIIYGEYLKLIIYLHEIILYIIKFYVIDVLFL